MSQFIEMFSAIKKVGINTLVDTIWGSSPDSSTYNDTSEGVPFYQGKTEFGDLYINNPVTYCTAPVKMAKKDSILMSVRAPVGAVNIATQDCCIGRGLASITPKKEKGETMFIYYALKYMEEDINRLGTGSTFKAINKDSYARIQLPEATSEGQMKFVEIAKQADKSGFDGLKSQFIEMFICSAERVALSSLCDTFIDGDWIEAKDQSGSGIRLIQTGNVGVGTFKDKDDKARYISEETFNRLNCTEVVEGDILISRLPDPVGRACIIPAGLGKSITAVDCTIIRLNDKVLPKFFVAFTSTPDYAMQIKKVLSGTTRLRVSRANLGKIQVPLPSVDKQQQFVTIAEQADKSGSVGLKSGLNFAKLLIHR